MYIIYGICSGIVPYGFLMRYYGETIAYDLDTDRSEWMVPGTVEV